MKRIICIVTILGVVLFLNCSKKDVGENKDVKKDSVDKKEEVKTKEDNKKGTDELTEEIGLKAVKNLLAQGTKLEDNSPNPAYLVEWQGLIKMTDNEYQGRAKIQHKDGLMIGYFDFHKSVDGNWVIDKIEFRSEHSLNYWVKQIFQRVEK